MELDINTIALSNPLHIGIVVKDIEKTTEFLSSIWGIGPWDFSDAAPTQDELMMGKPFKLKIAMAKLGSTTLELLQPVEGKAIWSEFIETSGEGVHHIAFGVSNFDEIVSKTKEQGGEMVAGGIVWGTTRWCYFKTQPGNIVVEFMEVS